jgi:hypothetical protein
VCIVATGADASPNLQIFVLAVLAGVYIGFGALLMLTVGGNCGGLASTNPGLKAIVSGLFGLPFGLLMVVVAGGELFTGNTALVTAAVLEGKATWGGLAKNWSVSYLGNLVGSLLLAWLACQANLWVSNPAATSMAVAKTGLAFWPVQHCPVVCVGWRQSIMCCWHCRHSACGCKVMGTQTTIVGYCTHKMNPASDMYWACYAPFRQSGGTGHAAPVLPPPSVCRANALSRSANGLRMRAAEERLACMQSTMVDFEKLCPAHSWVESTNDKTRPFQVHTCTDSVQSQTKTASCAGLCQGGSLQLAGVPCRLDGQRLHLPTRESNRRHVPHSCVCGSGT